MENCPDMKKKVHKKLIAHSKGRGRIVGFPISPREYGFVARKIRLGSFTRCSITCTAFFVTKCMVLYFQRTHKYSTCLCFFISSINRRTLFFFTKQFRAIILDIIAHSAICYFILGILVFLSVKYHEQVERRQILPDEANTNKVRRTSLEDKSELWSTLFSSRLILIIFFLDMLLENISGTISITCVFRR